MGALESDRFIDSHCLLHHNQGVFYFQCLHRFQLLVISICLINQVGGTLAEGWLLESC